MASSRVQVEVDPLQYLDMGYSGQPIKGARSEQKSASAEQARRLISSLNRKRWEYRKMSDNEDILSASTFSHA
jgi:hypothetical protein